MEPPLAMLALAWRTPLADWVAAVRTRSHSPLVPPEQRVQLVQLEPLVNTVPLGTQVALQRICCKATMVQVMTALAAMTLALVLLVALEPNHMQTVAMDHREPSLIGKEERSDRHMKMPPRSASCALTLE